MNDIALEILNISKTFIKHDKKNGKSGFRDKIRNIFISNKSKSTVVDNVSITVPVGAVYGILGQNGSGKSTLVRMVATLLLPDSGQITVFGHDVVKDPRTIQRMINRVSVDAAFFKKLSAIENLIYAGRLYGLSASTSVTKGREILEKLGFDIERADSSMEELSRGMQQKIAIARGFLTSPLLLLLDEPTTGLDPKSKKDVQVFIRQLREEHNATILLTTHDMAEAEALCDKIAIIDKGKIIAFDTPDGLREQCRKEDTLPSLEDVFIELTGKRINDDEQEEAKVE